ncbi:MAG: AAA family ATPase, partial [Sphingobacteriaceae bacterium]
MQTKFNSVDYIQEVKRFLPFTPNTQQTELIGCLAKFFLSSNENEIFVLKGYAGTGKTNIISAVTKALQSFKVKTVLMAPTG